MSIYKNAGGLLLVVGALSGLAAVVNAQAPIPRPVPDFGRYSDIPEAVQKPEPGLRYRVVFDIGATPANPAAVHPGLERVARMVNLLAAGGVRMQPSDIVVTVHSGAALALLSEAAHKARNNGAPNPNSGILRQLAAAGVSIRMCGQSMRGRGIAQADLESVVQVDTAAIVTLAALQLRGYAAIED